MRISTGTINSNIYHLSYASTKKELVISDTISAPFLKELNKYRKLAGYKASNLSEYLEYLSNLKSASKEFDSPRDLDIPLDELIFTILLIKFSFLFKINGAFHKELLKSDYQMTKNVIRVNKKLASIGVLMNTKSGRDTFVIHKKANVVVAESVEGMQRINIYKLIDDIMTDNQSYLFYLNQVLEKPIEAVMPELTDKALMIHISNSDSNKLKTVRTNFVDILMPPLASYHEITSTNGKTLGKIRRRYINKTAADYKNKSSKRKQEYKYAERTKFESDLAKFLNTYSISNDYDKILKKTQKK